MLWNKGKYIFTKSVSFFNIWRINYKKYKKIRRLLTGIQEQPQLTPAPVVVFNPVRSTPIHFEVELFLAYQLASRGANVKVLVDDGLMSHWDSGQYHNIRKGVDFDPYQRLSRREKTFTGRVHKAKVKWIHKIEKKAFEWAYRHKNLEVINYSRFLRDVSLDIELSEYDKNQAMSSTKRFFENGIVNLSNEEQKKYYQKSLENCRMSKQVGWEIVEQFRPDLYISSHGIYSTWGPSYRTVKDSGIKALIWDLHFAKNKKIVLVDDIVQLISSDSDWQQKKDQTVDQSLRDEVHKDYEERINHHALDTKIYFNGRIKAPEPDKTFDFESSESIIFGLFPNVYWDGNIYERNELFDDLIEWIEFTIEKIRQTDNKLVIRFHPSEATLQKGCKKLEEILLERNPNLRNYKNLQLISSDKRTDTYSFAKNNIDIGLIYSGTLALELTYLDIPVISCAKSFYYNVGFCFEPESKSQYMGMLQNGKCVQKTFEKNRDEYKQKLAKFSHWYFHDVAYELPILDSNHLYGFCYDKLRSHDVDPLKNKDFSRTLDKIIETMTPTV